MLIQHVISLDGENSRLGEKILRLHDRLLVLLLLPLCRDADGLAKETDDSSGSHAFDHVELPFVALAPLREPAPDPSRLAEGGDFVAIGFRFMKDGLDLSGHDSLLFSSEGLGFLPMSLL